MRRGGDYGRPSVIPGSIAGRYPVGGQTWLAALDAIEVPIFIHDAEHRVIEANRAYYQQAGLAPEEILGRPYYEIFPLCDGPLPGCRHGLQAAHPEGDEASPTSSEAVEEYFTTDAGHTFLSRSFTVHDEDGAYRHSVHILENITRRRRAEQDQKRIHQALLEREEQLHRLFENMTEGVLVVTPDGTVRYANPSAANLFARDSTALIGAVIGLPIGGPDAQEIGLRSPAGELRTVEMRVREIRWHEQPAHLLNLRDVTERKHIETELRRAAIVFEEAHEAILVTDAEQRVITANPAFTEMTGYTEQEVLGKDLALLRSGFHDESFYTAIDDALAKQGYWTGEMWNRCRDGTTFATLVTVRAIYDDAGHLTHYLAVLADISRLKEYQSQLERIMHSDPLTGLPNRLVFQDRLHQALVANQKQTGFFAVLSLDLNDLKAINYSLGHAVGDAILQQLAERLRNALCEEHTVARLGGDEFGVLLLGVRDASEVAAITEDLSKGLDEPFQIADRAIPIAASIGIAVYPEQDAGAADLFQQANAAMHQAKREGVSYRFFSEDLTEQARERVQLGSELREALNQGALELHYQPQIDLSSGAWVGLEALIRWHHPVQGWISPERFIPVAERIGLVTTLGAWVLEQACRQGRIWLDAGFEFGRLGVNFAAPELSAPDLAERVLAALDRARLPARYLEIEVTERLLVDPDPEVIQQLQLLRNHGVTVALDDFGTGYSALSYLRDLPVDRLKIDRSFVDGLPDDERTLAIAQAIAGLGRNLGFTIIAEGVETPAQREALIGIGCPWAQGFLFGRPAPVAGIEALAPHFPRTDTEGGHSRGGGDAGRAK
ncbi:sensor domain-containing protein [Halorhodospira halophila]|uniref:Diguanylate cyclase/phosphodiesterase with PAS/PAC sensor(S) n=1 Tax=Halorhodospira halophila (strain DSM 244 / SL1) TaxID=349124 RepID=A1WT40_HALHL|nr:EAL domain-containing protein [Halorhodospira halophila]ABM60852.1 diguanylate cyclase/phosphodiesterase with PAS/PAC sensor(s) [Halorhodospira halophila SL1]MBK1728506.1 GGDEF domain-containing protein [Halorhodospira halophila]